MTTRRGAIRRTGEARLAWLLALISVACLGVAGINDPQQAPGDEAFGRWCASRA